MARVVEEEMYATAAALGGMVTLALLLLTSLPQWQNALCGAVLVLILRGMRKIKTS